MNDLRGALFGLIGALLLIGCTPNEWSTAEKVAFETGLTKRCLQFHAARAEAHQRLPEISKADLERLHKINQQGSVICNASIDAMIEEIKAINEGLP